jgi:hypothetical protein
MKSFQEEEEVDLELLDVHKGEVDFSAFIEQI